MKYLFKNCVRLGSITVLLLPLLFFCSHVHSQKLSMKLSVGMFSGGKNSDSWEADSGYYDLATAAGERAEIGPEVAFSFTYMLHKNFGLSLGSGYIIKRIPGTSLDFTPQAENDFSGPYSAKPELYASLIPVYINAFLAVPVGAVLTWNITGGIAYYIGNVRLSTSDEKHKDTVNPAMIGGRLAWKYYSDVTAPGLVLGTELDWAIADSSFLSVEVLYRSVVFKNFERKLRIVSNSAGAHTAETKGLSGTGLGNQDTFLYLQNYVAWDSRADLNYRLSSLDLSGFAVRLGLKFKF